MPFSSNGTKWGEPVLGEPSGTITWSESFIDDLRMASGYTSGQFDAALASAFDTWESVASIDFQMVATGADLVLDATRLAAGTAGLATTYFSTGGTVNEISRAEIDFNSDILWAPTGSGGADFFAVALHEIGHILGLGHVNDSNEIMNPVVSADRLGPGDIAGAQYLYGTDPGDVTAPEEQPSFEPHSVSSDDGGGGGGGGGLLLGLLALLFGLFSGGLGAAAMVAAARLPDGDEDGESGEQSHADVSFLPTIPVEEFAAFTPQEDEDEGELWLV